MIHEAYDSILRYSVKAWMAVNEILGIMLPLGS